MKFNFELTRGGKSATSSESVAPKNYQNIKYGFSLQYPGDWRLEDPGQSGVIVSFFSPKEGDADKFIDNMNLTITDLASEAPMTTDQLADLWLEQSKSAFPAGNFNLVSSDPVTIAGLEGRKSIYTLKLDNVMAKGVGTMMIKDNKAYIVTFITEEANFDRFLPNLDLVLNSLTIN